MKKIIIFWICSIIAISANAEFKFKSLDNNDGKTTIVIVDDNFKPGYEICCAKFINGGKTYKAKSMVTLQEDDKIIITMSFKRMTVFYNTSVTLTINGQETIVPIDLTEIANQISNYKLLLP